MVSLLNASNNRSAHCMAGVEDISQKKHHFDAIIGARMNSKLGPGFNFIEDGYQDNDRCHAVNPRWPTLFSASVNKKTPHFDTERNFFTMSSKVRPFVARCKRQ